MAWDFETEPEFEEKLDWMRTFVREEIIPLGDAGGTSGARRRDAPCSARSPPR